MSPFAYIPWTEIVISICIVGLAFSLWIGRRQARALRDLTNDGGWLLSLLSLSWDKPNRERELRNMAHAIGPRSSPSTPGGIVVSNGRKRNTDA